MLKGCALPTTIRFVACVLIPVLWSCCAVGASEAALDGADGKGLSPSNSSIAGLPQVHVYVSNNDDDRLKVSLFVDGELKGSEEVGSKDEKKFGSYDLQEGKHSFVIAWRDEDTRKSYQEENVQEVKDGDSVILYVTRHDALEKFDVSVQVKNEAGCDLEANLYVDGNFEKAKEVKKDVFTDIGSIKLEEGKHDLSLRWRDKETGREYERNKQISVDGDLAVAFYTPKGCSFQSLGALAAISDGRQSKDIKISTSDEHEDSSKAPIVSTDDLSSSVGAKNITAEENRTENPPAAALDKGRGTSSDAALKRERSAPQSPDKAEARTRMETRYLYAVVVVLAVALLFRH
ncbi:MAG: hypothetical protein A4E45_01743 [Methanosaeta sp. PtaB.Bin039]|nr:MAG: hypothetical protein A4E45_01743 [Methanosaeta sp. PtaB.Bin039]HOT06953.1 hypothetical protein [Methanotrichaceae archaeon]HQF17161.1 hypothetical protein [Methanotrichaceae archaeon]HQI91561.1 hypothetical protein [Methanotrichaceae archaeon]